MKGQLAGVFIGIMVLILIGIGVVVPILSDTVATATELTSVTNDNITATLNNTAYDLTYTPVDELDNDVALYFFANTTFEVPAESWVYASDQVTIYANGTGGYPNITNGSSAFYYAYYDYQADGYIDNTASRMILGFVVLFIVVIVIIGILGTTGLGGKR